MPGSLLWVISAGHWRESPAPVTVTLCRQVAELPEASVAVQVRVVVPIGYGSVSSFFEFHAAVMGIVFIATILWAPHGIVGFFSNPRARGTTTQAAPP